MTDKNTRNTFDKRDAKPRISKKTAPSSAELSSLKEWLATVEIGVKPSVIVNGPYHPTALVVVDLGQPIKQIRLNSDQVNELVQRLKRVGKEVLGRDVNIRVSADNSHGIHWASFTS